MSNDPDAKYLIGGQQPPAQQPKQPEGNLIVTPDAATTQQVLKGPRLDAMRDGIDSKGRYGIKTLTTIDEVAEEHVYVVYRSALKDAVLEVDLLGDQAVQGSDGKLPPVINLECPCCTDVSSPEKRSILSITYGNKHFEIEDLPREQWGVVTMPDGSPVMGSKGKPAIVSRRLTIKEKIQCVYCRRWFKITDNVMSDA
jgi:hypothetical protein